MTLDDILQQLNSVFHQVFDDQTLKVGLETTAQDVEDWDSLTHINLVVAVEKSFGIRFTAREINHFANVGDMCRCIEQKLPASGSGR